MSSDLSVSATAGGSGNGLDGEGLLRAAAVQLQEQSLPEDISGASPKLFAKPKPTDTDKSISESQQRVTTTSTVSSFFSAIFKAPGPLSGTPATSSSRSTPANNTSTTSAAAGQQASGSATREGQGKGQVKEFTEDDEEEALSSRRRMRSSGMGGELGGFNQMSWLREPPPESARLRGRGGVTMSEVRQHKKVDDAWIVVRGKVYDITPYIKFHPGGADTIMKGAGRDGTLLFNKYHPWVNIDFLLEKCLVGILVPE